jgi:hypothetical protein
MENNKNMTAVEWLVTQLEGEESLVARIVGFKEYNQIIEQAKQMEKEQIRSAYVSGFDDGEYLKTYLDLEYYNETYGKDNG